MPGSGGSRRPEGRRVPVGAHAIVARPEGPFARSVLHETIDELSSMYDHVLVQVPVDFIPTLGGRRMQLLGSHTPFPVGGGGGPGSTIRPWAEPRPPNQPQLCGAPHVPNLI